MSIKKAPGKLRIIGGSWRGRKLPVADLEGLRPTADRVRETVFNWLAADLPGLHCLDLFAGTGALGLEALSRGAASCQFVERQRPAASLINDALNTLDALDRGSVLNADALSFLTSTPQGSDPAASDRSRTYGLVFLDPPFSSDLMEPALAALERSPLLRDGALIYLEYASAKPPQLPPGWQAYRSKRSGAVVYELYQRGADH
jgi:16S rRNA (guanine966-N2)-methyltransferase